MGESHASDPTEQTAKEASCAEKMNGCNANCEALRPQSENAPPPPPPEPVPGETPPPADTPPPPAEAPPAADGQPYSGGMR